MPTLYNGTKSIKFLLSKASKDIQKPLFRCFSYFWAHINFSKNQHLNLIWMELCGILATIVAENNVECRHFCNP